MKWNAHQTQKVAGTAKQGRCDRGKQGKSCRRLVFYPRCLAVLCLDWLCRFDGWEPTGVHHHSKTTPHSSEVLVVMRDWSPQREKSK
jgi:hypothetical protein